MPLFNPNTAILANLNVVSKTTTYTATTSDDVILVDTSGGAWTLTLYAASGNSGKVLRVVKTTSDTNALTIDGNASETINGFANIKLNYQFDEVTIVCDGTNWNIISQTKAPIVTKYLSGSGTHTVQNGVKYLRVRMVGGGGGGGGSGSGGGTGSTGGNTTFGTTLLVANGGVGGTDGGTGHGGGVGGSFSLGGVEGVGFNGQQGLAYYPYYNVPTTFSAGGTGGSGPFGGQVASGPSANSGCGGYGGGSAGTSVVAANGGGAGGFVDAIIYNPSSTYSYAVGAGGGGGSAGTNGQSGIAAAAGLIIVEEHYQ